MIKGMSSLSIEHDPLDDALKQCPCGETPTALHLVDNGQGSKWANVSGNCCNAWSVEVRTHYYDLDSLECMRYAVQEWNDTLRGA